MGSCLPPGEPPATIGPFTILDASTHLETITVGLKNPTALTFFTKPSGVLIECHVDARDHDKALDLADSMFHRFELIVRFIIVKTPHPFPPGPRPIRQYL